MARVAHLRGRVVCGRHVVPVDVGAQLAPQLLHLLGAAEAIEALAHDHRILSVWFSQEQVQLDYHNDVLG